jgi:hypothetical protein
MIGSPRAHNLHNQDMKAQFPDRQNKPGIAGQSAMIAKCFEMFSPAELTAIQPCHRNVTVARSALRV